MPGFSDEWICKQMELIAICYINSPGKDSEQKKKKKSLQVPIVALFGSHKGEVHSRSYGAEQIKLSTRSNVQVRPTFIP